MSAKAREAAKLRAREEEAAAASALRGALVSIAPETVAKGIFTEDSGRRATVEDYYLALKGAAGSPQTNTHLRLLNVTTEKFVCFATSSMRGNTQRCSWHFLPPQLVVVKPASDPDA